MSDGWEAKSRKQDAAIRLEVIKRILGRPFPHGTHQVCPKCGEPRTSFNVKWCHGTLPLLPENKCDVKGQHLHITCGNRPDVAGGCLAGWLERTADWSDEDQAQLEADALAAEGGGLKVVPGA